MATATLVETAIALWFNDKHNNDLWKDYKQFVDLPTDIRRIYLDEAKWYKSQQALERARRGFGAA